MPNFSAAIDLDASPSQAFQYHASPGAIDRLVPPWEAIQILERADSLEVGSEVVLENRQFGIPQRWLARHTALEPGRLFEDTLVRGPFRRWIHRHQFETTPDGRCRLSDRIEYELPLHPLSSIAEPWVQSKLDTMFRYRHRTTQDDLRAMTRLPIRSHEEGGPWKIAVTGSSGLIGRRVVEMASVFGWQVTRILRPGSRPDRSLFPRTVRSVQLDSGTANGLELLEDLDAVIHLSGYGIAEERWSDSVKRRIRDSRIDGTSTLVGLLGGLRRPPKVLVSGSGMGIFGDAADRVCRESDPSGGDFLGTLARDWEATAQAFSSTGGRVAVARFGMVLHPRFGALAKLLGPFRLGLGGTMGGGGQYWPWVHIDDAANILLHLATQPGCSGPYHVVAPEAVTNREFTRTLAAVLHRPSFLPVPAWVLRLAVGEMAGPLLLSSVRGSTERLLESGYLFRFPMLRDALQHLLGMGASTVPSRV